MKCEQFWERLADTWPVSSAMDNSLKNHQENCPVCKREFELLNDGFGGLKREIEQEEPAAFWHEMRQEVAAGVKKPGKIWVFWDFLSAYWRLGAGFTAALMVTVFFLLRTPGIEDLSLSEEEVLTMSGQLPCVSIYEDIGQQGGTDDENSYDPYLFAGLSGRWTSLLAEAS